MTIQEDSSLHRVLVSTLQRTKDELEDMEEGVELSSEIVLVHKGEPVIIGCTQEDFEQPIVLVRNLRRLAARLSSPGLIMRITVESTDAGGQEGEAVLFHVEDALGAPSQILLPIRRSRLGCYRVGPARMVRSEASLEMPLEVPVMVPSLIRAAAQAACVH